MDFGWCFLAGCLHCPLEHENWSSGIDPHTERNGPATNGAARIGIKFSNKLLLKQSILERGATTTVGGGRGQTNKPELQFCSAWLFWLGVFLTVQWTLIPNKTFFLVFAWYGCSHRIDHCSQECVCVCKQSNKLLCCWQTFFFRFHYSNQT